MLLLKIPLGLHLKCAATLDRVRRPAVRRTQ